jgi:hypothetical protein
MKSYGINLIVAFAAALILNNPAYSQTEEQKSQSNKISLPDSIFFNSLVSLYAQSIDKADTTLASTIWAPTAEISFISPNGTEYGWKGVKNIYKIFNEYFSSRKLSFSDVKFAYYDNVSWLTCTWIFDGTLRTDNKAVQTRGRETQIWKKINKEWRLVHVHYSEIPVSGQSY